MKKLFFSFVLIAICSHLMSQEVRDIRVEQSGDFIKISYKIDGSTPTQFFRVRALCSINGGPNIELRSVSGDAGDRVPGGKGDYFVVWDVLKDVETLGSAEFIIRAELVEGKSAKEDIIVPSTGFFLLPSVQLQGPFFGARIGVAGKAGFSVQFLTSNYVPQEARAELGPQTLKRISADLMIRTVKKNKFQMYLLTGISAGQVIINDGLEGGYNNHFTPGVEGGFVFSTGKFAFSICAHKQLYKMSEEGTAVSWVGFSTIGLGIRL